MKAYRMKRIIVGALLVILTLGFCVVSAGAAGPDSMGRPPQSGQQGFGPGGMNGPGGPNMSDDQQGFGPGGMNDQNAPDGQNFGPGDQSGQDGPNGQQNFGPGGQGGPNGQQGFGPGGRGPMDGGLSQAIDALEDGEQKTALQSLLEAFNNAMDALHDADDDSRESAEAAVEEAKEALDAALSQAGIEPMTPPEKPEGDDGAAPPAKPEDGSGQTPPAKPEGENGTRLDLSNMSDEQIQSLFQRFLNWLGVSGNT